MNDLSKNLVLWFVIAVVLFAVFSSYSTRQGAPTAIPYSQFLTEVDANNIREATIKGEEITGVKANNEQFVTYSPETENTALIGSLKNHGVKFGAAPPERQGVFMQLFLSSFPILLLIGVWIYFMRQMQGGGGKGEGVEHGTGLFVQAPRDPQSGREGAVPLAAAGV